MRATADFRLRIAESWKFLEDAGFDDDDGKIGGTEDRVHHGGVDGGGSRAGDTRRRGGVRRNAAAADRVRGGEEDARAGGDRPVREWRDSRNTVRRADLHDGGSSEYLSGDA